PSIAWLLAPVPGQGVPIASGHIRIAPRRLKNVPFLAGMATRWRISAYHADRSKIWVRRQGTPFLIVPGKAAVVLALFVAGRLLVLLWMYYVLSGCKRNIEKF